MCLYIEINREKVRECPYVGHVWKTALSWVCQVENGSFLSLVLTGPTAERWAHTHTHNHPSSHTLSSHHVVKDTTFIFPLFAFGCVCVCMWLFMSALPLALTLTWYVKSSVSLSVDWLWAGQWAFLSPHTLFTQWLCPLSNTCRGPGMPCVCLATDRVPLGETSVILF